jgi:hypothetical protein
MRSMCGTLVRQFGMQAAGAPAAGRACFAAACGAAADRQRNLPAGTHVPQVLPCVAVWGPYVASFSQKSAATSRPPFFPQNSKIGHI